VLIEVGGAGWRHFALDTKLDVIAEAVDEFLKGK